VLFCQDRQAGEALALPNFKARTLALDSPEAEGVVVLERRATLQGMEFTPTAEQDKITTAADTGENVVVTAVAGSGKTSTLKLIGASRPATSFLYLAFGKDIQTEMQDKLPNVESRTAHSLAYGYCKDNHKHIIDRLNFKGQGYNCPIKPWKMTDYMGLPSYKSFEDNAQTDADKRNRVIKGSALLSMVKASVTRFCRTADEQITEYHVVREFADKTDQAIFARFLLPFVHKMWADLTSPTGIMETSGDHYLKVWSLDCPQLAWDVILFDEAQDADPAIAHVVENQSRQVIMVGDASQAIYGWRGAVDALSKFEAPHRLTLTQSFRFGNNIATFANMLLGHLKADIRVIGNEAKDDAVTFLDTADAILCRSNAGVIEQAIIQLEAGKRVAIAGGTNDLKSFVRAAKKLMDIEATGRGFCGHGELGAFATWTDAVEHAGTEDGSDLRIRVKLVQTYGADFLLELLDRLVDVKKAKADSYDVVISTAHKAKGLEWDSVKIAPDFKLPTEEGEIPSDADLMLMYVAITRAKLSLDPGILAALAAVGV
jgi:superfamily I DNA/RNA helicase